MAAGDFKIMRNASNTDAIPNTGSGDLLLLWDTDVDNTGTNITYSSGTFTLGETGKFLVMVSDYVSTLDITNNERFNWKTTLTLDGSELVEGRSAGYIRKSSGSMGFITQSIAIIDVTTTGDELQIRSERIDNSTTGTANRVAGDRSGISIIKLDDSANYGMYRNSAATVASSVDNTAVVANIQTVDQEDSPFTRTTNTVDIATNNLVLAVYSFANTTDPTNRHEVQGRLTLGGSVVAGSYTASYARSTNNTDWGGMSGAVLLQPTSGQDLELEIVSRELGGLSWDNTLQLIELPSGAEAAIMEATTGNLNVVATDFAWDTLPHIDTAAFTATAGNTNIDVDNVDDYLVFASQAAVAYTAGARTVPAMQFKVNTTTIETAGVSYYNRGTGTAGFPTLSTAGLLSNLSANDSIFVHNDRIGTVTTTQTQTVGAFSVIRLSSLFSVSSLPTVTTQAITSIDQTTATGNGNITDLGNPNPTAHGVCWNTTGTPTTGDSSTNEGIASATGSFTSSLTSLSTNTLYYVRAYATNSEGTVYGDQVSFTTLGVPTVTTQSVSGIGQTTATGNGNITDLGNPNPTAHGVCWNTSPNPTTANDSTDEGVVSATGAFTSNMTGLSTNQLYYVRSYATNSEGTVYGSQVSFTTLDTPTVTTQAVTSIDQTTATGNSNITDLGNPNPTAHGVCWNTTGTPTTGDSSTNEGSASVTGSFTSNMTSLSTNQLYYVRSYATNTAGTVYGTQVTFTTLGEPTVTTQAVTSIEQTAATGNGNITDLGNPNPTAHGVCWNTTGTPTTSNPSTNEGSASATGSFTSNMTGLSTNQLYYVRSYATNSEGTVYGGEVSFTTLGEPSVTTQAVSDIGDVSATGNGNITDLGSPNPTAHGVCWNTTGTPTTANDKTNEGVASSTGVFTTNMNSLIADTFYYVRAYATNSEGTVYGGQVTFTTLTEPATQGMLLASADKSLTSAGSEDPGTYNFTESLPWGAITMALKPANSVISGTKFNSIVLPVLTLTNGAKIEDSIITGNVILDTIVDLNDLVINGNMDITNAGEYNFINVTVTGDVTNSDSSGNVKIFGTDGTDITTTEPGTGNDEVDIQIVSLTTLINLKDNTEVRVYDSTTKNEVAGIEDVVDGISDNRSFGFTYNVGNQVDIVVYNIDYNYEGIENYTILEEDSELPFQQESDINYLNP